MWQTFAGTINTTKFLPPKQQLKLLLRRSLDRQADEILLRRLLLVAAPAGYGKTSTLVQLHERLRLHGQHAAWLSLDGEDNDLVRFLAHLTDSIRRTNIALRPDALPGLHLGALHGPSSVPSTSALTSELLNELGLLREELFIFLDDLHLIHSPAVLSVINAMLLAPLQPLHLVIATRCIPDLSIARLRALDAVSEIAADQLAFTIEETHEFFLAGGGPDLSNAELLRLCDKTEGWAASLQMALIALRTVDNRDEFLASFSGADRSVAEFLVAEVLKQQPQPIRRFLLATSLLSRFNTGLANAVLGGAEARKTIGYLESHSLFIFSLDRDQNWYRYHHLFSELLRKQIEEMRPDLVREIHTRACDWLAENGCEIEAIEHAFAMRDLRRAGALIDIVSPGLFASAQTATLSAFAERLPPAILKTLPRLQMELAWENIIRWRFDAARTTLDDLRTQLQTIAINDASTQRLTETEADSLRMKLAHRDVMMHTFSDRMVQAHESAEQWRARYGQQDGFMGASINVVIMMVRCEMFRIERPQIEWASLRQQFQESRALYGTVFLDTVVGKSLLAAGDLALAEEVLRQGLATATRVHGRHSNLAAMPGSQLACMLYEANRIDEANELIESFSDIAPAWGPTDSVIARFVVQCRLASLNGNTLAAHRTLDRATQLADRYELHRLHARIAYERIRLLLSEGRIGDALRVTDDARYREGFANTSLHRGSSSTQLSYGLSNALLMAERGSLSAGITLLRNWVNHLRNSQCVQHSITLFVLLARLQLRNGERLAARRSLTEALKIGEGFIRSFLDGGGEIRALMQELLASGLDMHVCSAGNLRTLAVAFGIDSPGEEIPAPRSMEPEADTPLTARELDILRLAAKHLVAREVAATLGMAETTVKWYWRRSFAKLGVHRRAAAVRIAQQRGLIRTP